MLIVGVFLMCKESRIDGNHCTMTVLFVAVYYQMENQSVCVETCPESYRKSVPQPRTKRLYCHVKWIISQLFSDLLFSLFSAAKKCVLTGCVNFFVCYKIRLTPSLITHLPVFPHLSLSAYHPTRWASRWGTMRPHNLQLLLCGISTASPECCLVAAATALTPLLRRGSRPEMSSK